MCINIIVCIDPIRTCYWYDYLYSQKEPDPWVEKIRKIKQDTDTIFMYFNNYYSSKAIVNTPHNLKKWKMKNPLPQNEKEGLERAKEVFLTPYS